MESMRMHSVDDKEAEPLAYLIFDEVWEILEAVVECLEYKEKFLKK